MENLPSMSVTAPVFVPFTNTDAPMTGSPASSTIVPRTAVPCASATAAVNTAHNSVAMNFLKTIMSFFL